MQLFAGFGIGIVIAFVFMVLIGGLFMWVAARVARVERASFGRAMVAATACAFIEVLAAFIFTLVPFLGNLFGFIVGLILAVLVIKAVFRVDFGKALLVWIFNLVATLAAIILAAMITASAFLV